MNADQFSLKARRTTRIPLRIPVLVVIQEDDRSRSLDAWTIIVNIHGARIECKRRFEVGEQVVIQVPFNGMSDKGKVVWAKSEPNEHGPYEFGVELDRPENLWGVGFPPFDWEAVRQSRKSGQAAAVPAPEPAADVPADPSPSLEPVAEDEVPSESGSTALLEAASDPGDGGAVNEIDLTAEVLDWTSNPSPETEPAPEPTPPLEDVIMSMPESTAAATVEQYNESEMVAPACQEPVPDSIPISRSDPPTVFPAPARIAPTDQLSAIFGELVESVLERRLLGWIEKVGVRIEARAADAELSVIARLEQRVETMVAQQGASLEQRALEIVARQQELMQQRVQACVEDASNQARERQQKLCESSRQELRRETAQLLQSSREQLHQDSGELIAASKETLRQEIAQELSALESDMLEGCRLKAEPVFASQMEQWNVAVSDRVWEAQQSFQQQLGTAAAEASARYASTLEARSAQMAEAACAELEPEMVRIGHQVRQSFLAHIVTELHRSQQLWLEQEQRQLEEHAQQNVQWTRRNAQLFKQVGEALLRRACREEGPLAEMVPAPEAEPAVQPDVSFSETPVQPGCQR